MQLQTISGIDGLKGKEPVGAVLTVGHKGPKGNPIDTDRFFIVVPNMGEDGTRAPHPAFPVFNGSDPSLRQTMQGYLVHGPQAEAFEYHLKAQVLPGHPAHHAKAPSCAGDGKTAQRWNGQNFVTIRCPNDLCEFRKEPPGGKPTPCKPFARLLFRPKWKDGSPLQAPLMKLTTGSWASVRNLVGFFDYITAQAALLGIPGASLYGLPFTITLTRKSMPSKKRAFPVMSFSPDGDLQAFLVNQVKRSAELAAMPAVAALTDGSEQRWDVKAADLATISPGIPRQTATDVDSEPVE